MSWTAFSVAQSMMVETFLGFSTNLIRQDDITQEVDGLV